MIGIALAIGFHALSCGVDGYEFDIGYLACIVVLWPPLVAFLIIVIFASLGQGY